MNCGMNEDDEELSERGPTAPPATCGNGKLCGESTCCQKDSTDSPRTCSDKSGQNCGTPVQSSGTECDVPSRISSCLKCKTARAVVLVRQREPLCQSCLEAGISGKVRSLKANKLLLPGDRVVVAFSGGPSSQTLLCNVLAMRKSATTARKERGKIEFELAVLHVNEATAYGLSADAADAHGRAVQAAAQRCGAGGPAAAIHVVPLSDVFRFLDGGDDDDGGLCEDQAAAAATTAAVCSTAAAMSETAAAQSGAREARLRALLQSVPDPTGREDLSRCLRERLMGHIATRLFDRATTTATATTTGGRTSTGAEAGSGTDGGAEAGGYKAQIQVPEQAPVDVVKVLRGETATALAARIISDTAKGRGYSLPGDIQLVDGRGVVRGGPVVFQPMREVTAKEGVFFCRLRGLHPVQLPYNTQPGASRRRSVNALAASFVDGLQANLPSTIFTILRTASALKPFPFNSKEGLMPPPTSSSKGTAATATSETEHEAGCCGKGVAPATSVAPAENRMDAAAASIAELDRSGGDGGGDGCGGGSSGKTLAPAGSDMQLQQQQQVLLPCCALCRAPLPQREAAAATARALRVQCRPGASNSGVAGAAAAAAAGPPLPGCNELLPYGRPICATAIEEQQRSVAMPSASGDVREQEASTGDGGDDAEEDDSVAPFCRSCRNQILLTPEESAGIGMSVPVSGGRLGDTVESRALALLPASFRR